MVQPTVSTPIEPDVESLSSAQMVHSLLRLVLAVRYRKNLVVAVMAATALLGALYYVTAPRLYAAKSALLITQTRPDRLDTSITNEESMRQNTMPTFENMIRSAKVVEGALGKLAPADRIDLGDASADHAIAALQAKLSAKAIRMTSILEVTYQSKDPQVAVHVVQAVVQSYLDFMDRMQKGTVGEISRILTKEREGQAEKLSRKQEELLEARRHFADLGFRAEGKTLHPVVQRAIYFNDALIAAQKKRVECEALLAAIESAIARNEDLGQYLLSLGDTVGREMLLGSLGLGSRDYSAQATVEQGLLADRAQLQTLRQNLGPNHPEVLALGERIRLSEQFLTSTQERIIGRASEMNKGQLGPWLMQMVRQRRDGALKEEEVLQARFEETRAEAISLSGQMAQIEMLERDVKRLSDMNDVLLNQIASLDLKQNGQDVRVAVIEEPVVAASPVSPQLRLVALLTVLGGLAASLSLVTLLDVLDDRFRSVEELQSRLGLPLLTMVQHLQAPESVGPQALVTHALPTSTASESFRTLRTALTLTHPDARQIVVTSAEPGDGKTTTLANLAVCYAQAGKRTLLIDADLRRPGLTALMNMRGPHGLSEILRSDTDIGQMANQHVRPSGIAGLDVIPSGPRPSDPAELLSSPRLSQLLAWAETVYDLILVDSPPTLATTDTAIIGRLVDGVILVVQPAKNRRRLVTRVVERLDLMKITVLGLVVNRTNSDEDHNYYGYHSYGYGYGSGYEYGYGENAADGRDDAAAPPDEAAGEPCLPFAKDGGRESDSEEEAAAPVVPRRVA